MKKILFIFGTRPEAIKMAPLIKEFKNHDDKFDTKVCVTGQHREMLDQVLDFFNINPDYDLKLMKPNQTLFDITADSVRKIEKILEEYEPDNIWVQGDTTTVMTASIAGFYKKIKISHLEAGLRSNDKYSPFPEEINRKVTGAIADYHFAPTKKAVENLKKENVNGKIWNVGNTVIDALYMGVNIIKENDKKYYEYFKNIDLNKKVVLITGHRRESFGKPFNNICQAIRELAKKYNNIEFVYPVHLNPNVQEVVKLTLSDIKNIHLMDPLSYPYLIWLMNKSYIVLTDSGGIQEEAPALGKPVLVMRDVTERTEGIEAGTAKLVGTKKEIIKIEFTKLIKKDKHYNKMANSVNPYGDGNTCKKILKIYNELIS